MSLLAQYRAQARYNRWMNDKLYAATATLDDGERRRDRGAFFGSILGTLNHLLLTDRIWMLRFTRDQERYGSHDADGQPIAIQGLSQQLYSDFDRLRSERARTDADILAWTEGLRDEELEREIDYANMAGKPQRHVAWWAYGHLFNHQTHHRGQVTTLLFQAGVDPGPTDMIALLRSE